MKRVVVAIYIDPDFYPPTINAILNMAEVFEEVIVISRNNSVKDFPYPENVHLIKVGKYCSVREMEQQPLWKKIAGFFQFTFCLLRFAKPGKTQLLLLYDSFALFSFYLIKNLIGTRKVWYHNHDMPNKEMIKKMSIGGMAAKYESTAMNFVDIFSLPSKERLVYYSSIKKDLPVFIIPNFPSKKVYSETNLKAGESETLKIIFQGFIGEGHSIEEIIRLLPECINGKRFTLTLKGSVSDQFKHKINMLAQQYNVTDKVTWLAIGPYSEMPNLTNTFDIGIGINMNTDIVSKTQGTSSNKIYEYAASGLAVILYDSEQFTNYLAGYKWTYFTDGSILSLRTTLEKITNEIETAGAAARESFNDKLNFENAFQPAFSQILKLL